eukprot:gene28831-35765_t
MEYVSNSSKIVNLKSLPEGGLDPLKDGKKKAVDSEAPLMSFKSNFTSFPGTQILHRSSICHFKGRILCCSIYRPSGCSVCGRSFHCPSQSLNALPAQSPSFSPSLILDSKSVGGLHKWFNVLCRDILSRVPPSDPNAHAICSQLFDATVAPSDSFRGSIRLHPCHTQLLLLPRTLLQSPPAGGQSVQPTPSVAQSIAVYCSSVVLWVAPFTALVINAPSSSSSIVLSAAPSLAPSTVPFAMDRDAINRSPKPATPIYQSFPGVTLSSSIYHFKCHAECFCG